MVTLTGPWATVQLALESEVCSYPLNLHAVELSWR